MNYAAVPAPDERASTWTLLHRVYQIYRDHHRKFAAITIPAALFAALAFSMCRTEGAYLASRAPQGLEILSHPWEYTEILAIGIMGFFIPWLFECFAFAATATVVKELLTGQQAQRDIGDGYARARQCIRPIFVFAVLTFFIVALGFSAATWLGGSVMTKIANRRASHGAYWTIALGGWLLAIAFVTRYALAIPRIVHEKVGALKAMGSTVGLTDGYDGFLFLLAIESFIGTVVASYIGAALVLLVIQAGHLTQYAWAFWLMVLAAALASAFVQPPMFIGFSLLYFEQTRERHPAPISSGSFLPSTE